MKKILILFAHPALQKSRVNKQLITGLYDMEGVTFHDLYETYPELDIHAPTEQKLLTEHDIIIFHHPFFWYSTPAILKEWQDLVLEHGWAYGHEGHALDGKFFFNVITTGGQREAYCQQGYNNFTIPELLVPFQQTANLCGMIYLPPFVVHGTLSITDEHIQLHRAHYHQLLLDLVQDKLDMDHLQKHFYINDTQSGEK